MLLGKPVVLCLALAALLLPAPYCRGNPGLRFGGGVEVIPFKFIDLKQYNPGVGADIYADIVWGALTTTSLEMGYREFPIGGAWPDQVLALHRFGLIQRFYPMYARPEKHSPYLGLGLVVADSRRFSLNVPDAEYGGCVVMVGTEIPKGVRFRIDPSIRWDFLVSTDYFYSCFSLGIHLIWNAR